MPKKTPPFIHWPLWTQARWWSFLRSLLRSGWNRYPVKYAVLKEKRLKNDGRFSAKTKWMYECAECKEMFQQKEIQVDHKTPAGTLKSYEDIAGFVQRLFCGKGDLQIVCKKCHKKLTKLEKEGLR